MRKQIFCFSVANRNLWWAWDNWPAQSTDALSALSCWHRPQLKMSCRLLYLQCITKRTYCVAHGFLLSVIWQPGWEGVWGEWIHVIHLAESLCCSPKTITTLLIGYSVQFSSVQFSRSVVSDSLRPHESQHARPPCPAPTPRVYSNTSPSSRWCHPAISSSVVLFSSCPQSLPASGSFPMSQLFAWGGQSIRVSASASVHPMNTRDWSALGQTGWISLQSKGLSRVFSNTTFQKHQFFSTQLSSQSNSHIHTWPLEKR